MNAITMTTAPVRGMFQANGVAPLRPRQVVRNASATPTVAIFKTKTAPKQTTSGRTSGKPSEKGAVSRGQSFEFALPGYLFASNNDLTKSVTLGFTKANELFVGRMAMIGFGAALLGELVTGKGALAQFDLETGINLVDTEWGVLLLIAFNVIAAISPTSGKFVDDIEDERPEGALQNANVTLLEPRKFFGISKFGFTKENELFVGRVAQLGFAAALIGEVLTGQGPLAQFDLETGLSLGQTEPLLLAFISFFFLAAINEGRGNFVDEEA